MLTSGAIAIWDDLYDSDRIYCNFFSEDRIYADGRYILFQSEAAAENKTDELVLIDIIEESVTIAEDRITNFDYLDRMNEIKGDNIIQDSFGQTVSRDKHMDTPSIKFILRNDKFQIVGGIDPNGPNISVKKVILDIKSISLMQGEQYHLYAIIIPYDATKQSVKWSSSNNNVASVDKKGNITPKKVGVATIKVTTTDGKKNAVCKVTVEKNPYYYIVGQTAILNCHLADGTLEWVSSDTSKVDIIDTYRQSCTIKCLQEGTATVIVYFTHPKMIYDTLLKRFEIKYIKEDYYHYNITITKD